MVDIDESAAITKKMAGTYDANGRRVQNIFITNKQQHVNVHQLSKGAYIIKFADGTTKSFIKK